MYGILSQYGYICLEADNKKEAEKVFAKDFDITKYPVKRVNKSLVLSK